MIKYRPTHQQEHAKITIVFISIVNKLPYHQLSFAYMKKIDYIIHATQIYLSTTTNDITSTTFHQQASFAWLT